MKKELTELQKLDCKTAPYEMRIYRKARRVSQSHTRILGNTGDGAEGQEYAYHVMSRTAGGEFLFEAEEKEGLKRLIWKMAKFCGVKVLTYCVMDNHFHILVRVKDKQRFCKKFYVDKLDANGEVAAKQKEAAEDYLLKHLSLLYSKSFIANLKREISYMRDLGQEAEIEELLDQFRDRFCDLSLYMKEVKERFTRWYNKKHLRRGTLWSGRFKSVLVEDGEALRAMSSYIDLNSVRAGIVKDPKDYRWCGYAEAVAGSSRAGRGLCDVLEVLTDSFSDNQNIYRMWLFGDGMEVREDKCPKEKGKVVKKGIEEENVDKVIQLGGKISRYELLRSKIKYFSEGLVLGGEGFIRAQRKVYLEGKGFSVEKVEEQLNKGRRKESVGNKGLMTWRW